MTAFNNVPENWRSSKNFIELAGVKKSLADLFIPPTGLLVGMYDPAKSATVDYVPIQVLSADDVGSKAGFGSHAHRQALRFPPSVFSQGGGVWWSPIPEAGAGVAANDTVTFTGTATSAGTLFFQIGGELIQVGVIVGDAFAVVATSLKNAIAAKQNIAITGAAVLGVVTNTAKFKGTAGNQIEVIFNPGGEVQENQNPAGITTVIGNADGYLSSGATDPSVEDTFFNSSGEDILGDRWYTDCTMPFTDQTNIDFHKLSSVLRKDPTVNRMYGHIGGYILENYAAALALPASTNGEFIGEIWEDRCQGPAFELAAALVGTILDEKAQAPNRPYKTLAVGIPADANTINIADTKTEALYQAGMSFCKIDTAGVLRFGDIALTRRTNDLGGSTDEWFDYISMSNRQAKAYSIEQLWLTEKYSRAVVVANNDPPTKVAFAIRPKDIVADLTQLILQLWSPFAWSKNIETIISSLSAEINAGFGGRIDGELTDDEAKALRIIAIRYAYLY